jgi:hypothetical protein
MLPRSRAWLAALAALAPLVVACSSSDDTSGASPPAPVVYDAGVTKLEAGAPCLTPNDCAAGLTCLYVTPGCDAFRICTAAQPDPCPQPVTGCSCIGHTIPICAGYASEPIDHQGACDDSGNVGPVDSGHDAADTSAPPADAGDAATE